MEVVICSDLGVLLARRIGGACDGLWALPGGTVRFAEPLVAAVNRVALDEINADVVIDELRGYIECASHTRQGIDSPVGLAFRSHLPPGEMLATVPGRLDWFRQLPDEMHDEQRAFQQAHRLAG
ncbi:MAG: NUDIX hydrolase [Acidimicrobiales bacterium]